MNRYLKRILALTLCLLLVISGCIDGVWAETVEAKFAETEAAVEAYASEGFYDEEYETVYETEEPVEAVSETQAYETLSEESVPEEPVVYDTVTGYPLLEAIRNQLNQDEILEIQDACIAAGEAFGLIDPLWLDFGEDMAAPYEITVFGTKDESGNDIAFSASVPGAYTVYYIVTPASGHPAYEISRIVTVTEAEIVESPLDDDASAVDETEEIYEEYDDGYEAPAIDNETVDPAEEIIEEIPSEQEYTQNTETTESVPEIGIIDPDTVTETTESTETTETTEQPVDEIPVISDVPETTETSTTTDVPVISNGPDTTDASASEIPAATEVPVATDVPVITETQTSEPVTENNTEESSPVPETSAEPTASETSQTTDDPNATTEPEATAEPEATTDPTTTVDPEATADPSATEEPTEDEDDEDDIAPDNIVIEGSAKVTRGSKIKYPSDLGSSYSTFKYYVDGKFAYCLEADRSSPKGGNFAQEILESNADLIKALYYGYGGPGDLSATYYPNYSANVRTVLTHIAVSYFYTGSLSRATKGCSSKGVKKYDIEGWIDYIQNLPDPPSPKISLSDKTLEVVRISGGIQTTNTTTLNADSRNSITVTLPDEVTYHSQGSDETQTGGSVTIAGGTTFYFTAPATLTGTWETGDMNGSISHIWKALIITTGTKTQNLGSYASETYGGSVHFSVNWTGQKTLTIVKADADDNNIHLAGAVINVFGDADCLQQLALVTTDENGTATCTLPVETETVYLLESEAPSGYRRHTEAYAVTLNGSSVTVVFENEKKPDGGTITVCKTGEALTGYADNRFIYENRRLANCVFEVYAEDGTLVATLTTDANGEAQTEKLPFGTYTVSEKQAAEGYVLNRSVYSVTLSDPDENRPMLLSDFGDEYDASDNVSFDESGLNATICVQNSRQKHAVTVEKQNADGTLKLPGASFALYAGSDIVADNTVIVTAGSCLSTAVTDERGLATFDIDLPIGSYLIGEIVPPDGYQLSDEVQSVEVVYHGQETARFESKSIFKDDPIQLSISKADATTGVELDGASMILLDAQGNVIDSWTSVAVEPHIIEGLDVGSTYTLREEIAPYGYLLSNSVEFTVTGAAEGQKVTMTDEVPTGTIIISKSGEFLSDVSSFDTAGGKIGSAFGYITGQLQDVTFGVYAYEDILYADGVSGKYYSAGDLVATITTDSSGIARIDNLPLGKYYVQEIETQNGYVLDNTPRMIDLSYRDSATPVVTYSEDWQNERKKASVLVHKQDNTTQEPLEGAVFALFTGEDITCNGNVVMAKDTLIEQRATDSTGSLAFGADLPIGFDYYICELVPPQGYFCDTDTKCSFSFTGETADQTFKYTFWNQCTQVAFSKASLTTGLPVEGAHLQVSDADGNIIDSWVTDSKTHTISGLVIGKTYTLTETLPADGYTTAESITFTVENTGRVQKATMQDDVTKLQISKTDIGGNELEGATLTILDAHGNTVASWVSTTEPHYIEMLPIGKYTLHEEAAPDGYTVAEDVAFEIIDTGEIQKVAMVDGVTKLQISKTDIAGNEIAGAQLTLLDAEGNTIVSWTSDTEPHYIEMLSAGTYTLHEETAPDGYIVAEDITFEVQTTGEIQKVTMKDDCTKLQISKTDIAGNELACAKLTLLDANGNTIDSWTSTTEPHYIEKLPVGRYTLHEESAPDGYTVAEDITFEVQATGDIQKVTMQDAAVVTPTSTPTTTTSTSGGGSGTPKTGDERNPLIWAVAGGIGLLGFIVAMLLLGKRKR